MENICLPFHLFTYRRGLARTREQPNDEISFRDAFPRLAELKASGLLFVSARILVGRRISAIVVQTRERERVNESDVDKMAEIGHYPSYRRYRWSSDHRAADEPNQIGRGKGAI